MAPGWRARPSRPQRCLAVACGWVPTSAAIVVRQLAAADAQSSRERDLRLRGRLLREQLIRGDEGQGRESQKVRVAASTRWMSSMARFLSRVMGGDVGLGVGQRLEGAVDAREAQVGHDVELLERYRPRGGRVAPGTRPEGDASSVRRRLEATHRCCQTPAPGTGPGTDWFRPAADTGVSVPTSRLIAMLIRDLLQQTTSAGKRPALGRGCGGVLAAKGPVLPQRLDRAKAAPATGPGLPGRPAPPACDHAAGCWKSVGRWEAARAGI